MIQYSAVRPKLYVETTVISYLVARPSNDASLVYRQQITRQLWEECADDYEFVVSDIVISEILRGDAETAQRRFDVVANLTILDISPDVDKLTQDLIDAGAVPHQARSDAQHITFAAVNSIDYLVSWNYKHIVNEIKRQLINEVCHAAGFQSPTICTPIEIIEEAQMREKVDTYTDAVLEECYRMKEEFNAQFNSVKELSDYLKAENKKRKALGWKYVSVVRPHDNCRQKN